MCVLMMCSAAWSDCRPLRTRRAITIPDNNTVGPHVMFTHQIRFSLLRQFSAKSPKTFGPAALQGSTSASGKEHIADHRDENRGAGGPAQRVRPAPLFPFEVSGTSRAAPGLRFATFRTQFRLLRSGWVGRRPGAPRAFSGIRRPMMAVVGEPPNAPNELQCLICRCHHKSLHVACQLALDPVLTCMWSPGNRAAAS